MPRAVTPMRRRKRGRKSGSESVACGVTTSRCSSLAAPARDRLDPIIARDRAQRARVDVLHERRAAAYLDETPFLLQQQLVEAFRRERERDPVIAARTRWWLERRELVLRTDDAGEPVRAKRDQDERGRGRGQPQHQVCASSGPALGDRTRSSNRSRIALNVRSALSALHVRASR